MALRCLRVGAVHSIKLGRWDEYFAMREGILGVNARYRNLLSNDIGAIAGLLYDIGSGRYAAPPRNGDVAAQAVWEADLARVREANAKAAKVLTVDRKGEETHTEVQGWLRELGRALGYAVWVAANDRNRLYNGGKLAEGCVEALPEAIADAPGAETVRLIDVLWLDHDATHVVAAFEVEHSTSIYSGIVRMLDLALGDQAHALQGLFLVAPDNREDEVRAQLLRPAFRRIADLKVKYLPYGELKAHKDAITRFGSGMKAIQAVSRDLT